MTSEKSLTVVDQREVTFYGDELIAVRTADGHVYVALRQMCQALGLDSPSQVRRIKRHAILSEGLEGGVNLTYPSEEQGGGPQKANVLRVDLVPLWLSGIRLSATKETIRPKLERYQREAAVVLWEAFQEGRLTGSELYSELMVSDSPAAQAYRTARAVLQLAKHQFELETKIEDHGRRLEAIEATLGDPGRNITPEQASQLSQAVKAVAMKLSEQSGRNEYGGVYGELYRKFGITGYKLLPANRFQEAMDWLTGWYQSITDADVPF
jgi:hypothetical protein